MELRAYNIAETIEEIGLSKEKSDNVDNIFKQILGDNKKKKHLSVQCCLKSEHQNESYVLYNYYKNKANKFDYSNFARELFSAEKTNDGITRKKTIQEGYLFIKSDGNNLYLMKLEKIDAVDSKTFEIKGALGADDHYYKLCVFENDFDNVIIVDKNTRLAVYWFEKFLGLSRVRDENQNTSDLIELIDNKELYLDMKLESEAKANLYRATEDYLFENKAFDKIQLLNFLNRKEIINNNNLDEVFSEPSSSLDCEFNVSSSVMKARYKKTLKISNETEIRTDNFVNLIRRQGIEIKENKIILTIDKDFLETVQKELK